MYFLFLTFGMCSAYFVLYGLFSLFFKNSLTPLTLKSLRSIAIIIATSFLVYAISLSIKDRELGNRVMHALGGGFQAFLVCFLVVKDSRLKLGRLQFFIFSFLIVTALGVANEIMEFFLQNYVHLIFARNINDTWLDLLSNTVGAFIAGACLVSFL